MIFSESHNLDKHANFSLSLILSGLIYDNSSIRNDNSGRKPAEENQSSKNIGKKTVPFKGQKRANSGCSRAQILNAKDSGGVIDHAEISSCSQNESLECDETDMAKKKNLDHSG